MIRDPATGKAMTKFGYYVDFDERGMFAASVRDYLGRAIYKVKDGEELLPHESSIFADGYMKHHSDLDGLTRYLQELDYLPADGEVLPMTQFEAWLESQQQVSSSVEVPTYTQRMIEDIGDRIMAAVPSATSVESLGSGAPGAALRAGTITPLEAAQFSHAKGFRNVDVTGASYQVRGPLIAAVGQDARSLYLKMRAADGVLEHPTFMHVELDQQLAGKIEHLRQVCQRSGIDQAAVNHSDIQTSTTEYSEGMNFDSQALHVRANSFWFVLRSAENGYDVVSDSVDVRDLVARLDTDDAPRVLWDGMCDYENEVIEFEEESSPRPSP